jgi:hypothetical protein
MDGQRLIRLILPERLVAGVEMDRIDVRSRVLRAQAIQSHFTEAYQRGALPPPFSDFERAWEKYEDDGKQYS